MLEGFGDILDWLLGISISPQERSFWQIGLRAVIVYGFAVALIRLVGDRRFIGKHAAIDVLLTVILGSTLSRTINGSAPFFSTLAAVAGLVGMHWLFNAIAVRFEGFDTLLKGHSRVLIQDGQLHRQAMGYSHISQGDLDATLRLTGKLSDPSQVKIARLESSGDISVLPKDKSPQVLEVTVEDNVQTIRIQLN
jgi:uncharacterized membrane protein YcaP (DUF421 family)